MTAPADGPVAAASGDVPATLLLGRCSPATGCWIHRLARRLAGQLGHTVEPCDLEGAGEPLQMVVRRVVEQGTTRLVVLPLTLDGAGGSADTRHADAMAPALRAWPFLRVHRGRPPATDDVARMLGDRARDAVGLLSEGRRRAGEVVVVIATGDGANPAGNAEVAKLARLVYEAHRFGDVGYAFVGLTTPSVGELIARWSRLGARGIVVVPHLLFDPRTHRRLVRQARAGAAAAGVEVAVARPLDAHPALVWALVRRHLEALSDTSLLAPDAGGAAPWVNPALLGVLQHAHRHGPGVDRDWQARMAALLPPRYRDPGLVVESAPMRAAPLQRDAEGRVAWDQMWQGFCELGLAGGPPHRGTLLEAVPPDQALENPARYAEVRAELARGLTMVTGLPVVMCGPPGWIGVACVDEAMAVWLLRAILVENVMVRREGAVLYLPAGARFTLEDEIKNVITAVAKTYHYWTQHAAARDVGPAD
jgi:sirohydrochlorin cobaltochelatase